MINYKDDDVILDFGTRKGSSDKLSYRQILLRAFMKYIENYGSFNSKTGVQIIMQLTSFDEPGMELRKEITVIKENLIVEQQQKWDSLEKKIGHFKFNKHATQAKLKIQIQRWYWDELFRRILQVIADNQLLVDHNKLQKIRMKKTFDDRDDEQQFEEPIDDLYT